MAQNYKVYFSNRPVFFTHVSNPLIPTGSGISAFESKGKMDTLLIENAITRGARAVYVLCNDVEQSWQLFYDQFEFVQAAGGVVVNTENKLLFIYRLEKWDLPKGKVEQGESLEEGALREVEEECAITNLKLRKSLCTSWHTYVQNGEPVLKATAWYIMDYSGDEIPKPQIKEGITEAIWLAEHDWERVKKNTYPSVLDVLRAYLDK